jgi:hypothetical protein
VPGQCTGISFLISTPIRVCKNKRIKRNQVFKDIAVVGKSIMGYFFGFKLHLIINDKGEILSFVILRVMQMIGNRLKRNEWLIKATKGKLCADKGYFLKS